MTRVALTASSFLPRRGGVEEHVAHVAPQLARDGRDVVVWAVDRGDVPLPSHDGVPIRYLPCPLPSRSVAGIARFVLRFPRAFIAWARAYRRDKPDVIHIQCFGPNGVYSVALAALARRPFVYSHHGETIGDADNIFGRSALLRRALQTALRRASAVTSVSASAAAELVQYGPSTKPLIVPNGVALDSPTEWRGPAHPAPFVLGVGRLVENKGFDTLIRAFAEVADEPDFAGVDLVIGGDGPERGSLLQLAGHLGLSQRVVLLGMLDRDRVAALMAACDAVVVPSRVESFGIVVLEAWSAGAPVIVPNRGGPAELTVDGETALQADPDDPVDYARALRTLFTDSAVRDRLGRAGREAVREYSWNRTAHAYEVLYEDVLHDGARM